VSVVNIPMDYTVRIWSKAFAPSSDPDPYSIQVDKRIWETAMEQEGARRKFVRIAHGEEAWIAPMGQPVTSEEEGYNMYVPLWMIDAAHLGGTGEEVPAQILSEEFFPEATKIRLRVIDSAFYNADVKDELEKALSSLGVIQEHTTLQIPVTALDGFTIEVFVSSTEPANIVLCDGEEVALEFDEPVDQIAPPRPPTPLPQPPAVIVTDTMVPDEFLGTVQRNAQGFRPFQGEGRIIGSSNANIPEWRRELGPPRRREG
jgi:hypothetical protein